MNLSTAVRDVRLLKGMTQKEVSAGNVSQSTYSKFEKGIADIPTQALIGILKNLDINLDEVLFVANGNFTIQQISHIADYLNYPFTFLYLISNNHQELFGANITNRILESLSSAKKSSLNDLKDIIEKVNEAKENGVNVDPQKFEHLLNSYKQIEGTMEFDRFFKSKIFNENNNSLDLYDILRNNNVKFKGKELNSKQKELLNTLISEIID